MAMNNDNAQYASVNIRHDILRRIDGIASQQHVEPESLVNHILEQYVDNHPISSHPSEDALFLLSIAGIFESDEDNRTSERVHEIVKEFVETKYAKQSDY